MTGLGNRRKLEVDLEALLDSRGDPTALVLLELDGLQTYSDRFGLAAGDDLLRRSADGLVEAISAIDGTAYRIGADRLAALVPLGGRQLGEVVLAATAPLREEEPDQVISGAYGEVAIPDEATGPKLAFQIARNGSRPTSSASTGRLGSEEIDDIALAAELQKIGLLAMPDAGLDSGVPLPEEAAMARHHTIEGERIIGAAPGLAPVARLVRSTSEHFDGSGYPDGLVGEAIPLGSRIIAISAAFTEITSPQGYRSRRSVGEALSDLRRWAGTQFDPRVVEALAADLAEEAAPAPG